MSEAYAVHMLSERAASCRGLWPAGQKRTRSAEVPGRRAASCIGSVREVPGGYTGMAVSDRGRLADLSQSQEIGVASVVSVVDSKDGEMSEWLSAYAAKPLRRDISP